MGNDQDSKVLGLSSTWVHSSLEHKRGAAEIWGMHTWRFNASQLDEQMETLINGDNVPYHSAQMVKRRLNDVKTVKLHCGCHHDIQELKDESKWIQ